MAVFGGRAARAPEPAAGDEGVLPITLDAALRLAQTSNLDIARAREALVLARVGESRARLQIIPSLNLGGTYVDHEGNIQKTEGNIIKANRDSLFVGGGPSVAFGLADAIFAPLVARRVSLATQAGLARVNNDTLLAAGESYFAILRARRRLARVGETLDYLTSERQTPARANSKGLLPLVSDFVQVGAKEAFRSELERVRVEVLRREEEQAGALQELRIASAELARLIRLDPLTLLWPVEEFRFPLPLPGAEWLEQPVEELVRVAFANRPDLAENQALVDAAVARVQAAKARPWLPSAVANFAWGDFGGSPDPNTAVVGGKLVTLPGFEPSGRIRHFNTRSDFDVSLVWRFQNMGLGNMAEVREQQSVQRQTEMRRQQTQDLVAAQVVQALEAATAWRERVAITRRSMFDEKGAPTGPVFRSLQLSFDRIKAGEGRPLEVLDSIRGLNDLLDAYGQAVTDYERARFRLLIVLGLPPETIVCGVEQAEAPPPETETLPLPRPVDGKE